MLVRHGFKLTEISEMTLAQMKGFVRSVNQLDKAEYLNNLGMTRTAYHADANQYKSIVRDFQKD